MMGFEPMTLSVLTTCDNHYTTRAHLIYSKYLQYIKVLQIVSFIIQSVGHRNPLFINESRV